MRKLQDFYQGIYYPILAVVLALLSHATALEAVFLTLLLLTVAGGLLLCEDLKFAVMPVLCATFGITTGGFTPSAPGYERFYENRWLLGSLIVGVLAVLVSLVLFVLRNCKRARLPGKASLLWGMLVFCMAIACNGFFSPAWSLSDLAFVASMAVPLAGVYLLFHAFMRFEKGMARYLMYCFFLTGILLMAELFFAYLTRVQITDGVIEKGSVVFGWGVWTNMGGMLAFMMPACFYFASESERHAWIGYATGLLLFLGTLLSQSRGALVVGGGILCLCLLALCLTGRNRRVNRFLTLGVAAVGVVGGVLLFGKVMALLQNFLNYGFADNGRMELWRSGLTKFSEYPVFGAGFHNTCYNEGWNRVGFPSLCHNTVVQLLGSCGAIGFLGYAYHRFDTVRLFLKKRRDPAVLYSGLCILSLLLFSLLDVLFFKSYPIFFYVFLLMIMENAGKSEDANADS